MIALLYTAIRLALGAIARNKTRAALTVLGILIGVSAVVMVTALAGGASQLVVGQIDSFGSNMLFVNPQPTQTSAHQWPSLHRRQWTFRACLGRW